ncbi:MAG: restriction endonuclease subunit S [Caldisericaceae bacterium]
MKTVTHKGKRHNVEYSVVNVSELEGELRIDAEYYEPYFLRYEALIRRKQWCKIGDLVDKVQYGLSLAMNGDGKGHKILKMDDIIGILADDSNCKYIDIDEKTFEMYRLKKGDILFNRVNSEEFVGRTGIYLLDGLHTFASYLIRMKAKECFTNFYITIYLNTKYGRVSLKRVMRRAVNQANINAEEIKSLTIPILSDTFQKQIEKSVLRAYEEKEKSESLYKQAEDILLEELGLKDWKPKTKKIVIGGKEFEEEENISIRNLSEVLKVNRFDAEYWEPKYDEMITTLKEKIELMPLKAIATTKKGSLIDPRFYNNAEGTSYIRGKDFSSDHLEKSGLVYISSNFQPKNETRVNTGDLVFALIGSVGTSALVDEEFNNSFISNNIGKISIRNKKEVLAEYLAITLHSIVGKLEFAKEMSQTAQPKISDLQVRNFYIPLLPIEIQQKIASLVQKSHEARKKSKELLEIAKRAVEIAIEKNEKEALSYISKTENKQ